MSSVEELTEFAMENLSIGELKAEVTSLVGEDAVRGIVDKAELVNAFVEAVACLDDEDDDSEDLSDEWKERVMEVGKWAMDRPLRDLQKALAAMGEPEGPMSKKDMVRAYLRLTFDEGKMDPTATHMAKDCTNCPECRRRRRELRKQERDRRRAACDHCGAPAEKLCSKCLLSSFCSPECMAAGWKAHKVVCKHRQVRDQAINEVLGVTSSEYCVHYYYFKGADLRAGCGSLDIYKGRCLTMDAVSYDDKTTGDLIVLHFTNKAPDRTDDQHGLAYLGAPHGWKALNLEEATDSRWPDVIIQTFFPQFTDVDPDTMTQDDIELYGALDTSLTGVHRLCSGRCSNPHCKCMFKKIALPTSNNNNQQRGRRNKKKGSRKQR